MKDYLSAYIAEVLYTYVNCTKTTSATPRYHNYGDNFRFFLYWGRFVVVVVVRLFVFVRHILFEGLHILFQNALRN